MAAINVKVIDGVPYYTNAQGQPVDPKTGKPRPVEPPSYINPSTGMPREVLPPTPLNTASVNLQNQQDARSQQFIDALMGGLGSYQGAVNQANQTDTNALGEYLRAGQNASAAYSGVANNVRSSANNYNTAGANLYGGYAGALAGLNAQDQGTLGRYMSETDPLMAMMSARGSDPADIQRQLSAYNMASGIAGGSLDYQAATAQAVLAQVTHAQAVLAQNERYSSNPEDVRRQIQALEDIKRDLQSGGVEQRAAMEKFKALSDPEVTAKERFMSEVARREFESADKSSRDAVSSNLAARGLRSGGMQIAKQQAARSQLAQDRLLKELGIQAQAVDRAQQSLAGWGNMANAIRASDQTALGLQSAQGNAIRDMNDRVGMFNTAEQNTTNRYNAGLQTQTNQFNAAQSNQVSMHNSAMQTQTNQFNAGQINTARANNQATRMQGANLTALQSNAIRSANDQMSQFQDQYRHNEATRVGDLAGQRAQTGLQTTSQMGTRVNNAYDAGTNLLDTNYGRDQDANNAEWDAISKGYDIFGQGINAITGTSDRAVNRAGGVLTNIGGTAASVNQLDQAAIDRLVGAYDLNTGERIARGARIPGV